MFTQHTGRRSCMRWYTPVTGDNHIQMLDSAQYNVWFPYCSHNQGPPKSTLHKRPAHTRCQQCYVHMHMHANSLAKLMRMQ